MSTENKENVFRKFFDKQQPFSGIFGVILTCIVTLIGGSIYVSIEYIPVSSFDVLVKTYFVEPGLISENILELKPQEQFETIAKTLSETQSMQDEYKSNLENILVSNGVDAEDKSLDELYGIVNQISKDYMTFSEENSKYEGQTLAKMMSTRLIVDGEELDVDIPNSVATVDGHYFYSESLLNSFLDETISIDSSNATVYYGDERAEKAVFDANMITDITGFTTYAVGKGESFTMGTETYDNGFVETNSNTSRFYANLKGEYSKISFVVGHIDGTNMENGTLYVYTKNGNDQYRLLKTFELTSDMFPEEKTVEINYADGVQIVIEGSYWGRYALADLYLYR